MFSRTLALATIVVFGPTQDAQDPAPEPPPHAARYAQRFTGEAAKLDAKLVGQSTLDAVSAGLAYLAGQQGEGGSWPAASEPVAAHALALLAFLGDGHTTIEGRHTETVGEALAWLRAQQEESGRLGQTSYEHAIGTLALCEAWNLTRDPVLEQPAKAAVKALLQAREGGIWGAAGGDVVETAWAMLALGAATDGQIGFGPVVSKDAVSWLKENTRSSGAVPRNRESNGFRYREIAAALHTNLLQRAEVAAEIQDKQIERLLKRTSLPAWPDAGERVDMQYWFWAGSGLRLLDDKNFGAWQEAQVEALVPHQGKDGAEAGSWAAVGTEGECTGVVYATAYALLCLELPYRVAPPPKSGAGSGVLGIAGPALDGPFGGRFGGRRNLRAAGGSGTEQALKDALEWLKRHQAPDGRWDADGFAFNKSDERCDCADPGEEFHDIGVTGLALLAFLGDGSTTVVGPYRESAAKGVAWLLDQVDAESGKLGRLEGGLMIYDQVIGTYALVEAYALSQSPVMKAKVQKAVDYVVAARNPYGAWRYDVPPVGENDTSVTVWAIATLHAAEGARLAVDKQAFVGALNWFDEVTDHTTGRTGYDSIGSTSARVPDVNDHFPVEHGEAMTAAALYCRFVMGQSPDDTAIMTKNADLLLKTLPEWDPDGFKCDVYYWYYGSYAMYQMDGRHWDAWNKAMKSAVLSSQRKDGDHKGSWDAAGPWGHYGGRVYSTAMMALCLEVYFRYPRFLGAR